MLPTPKTITNNLVYDPCEDSFFLLDCLEKDREYISLKKSPIIAEIGSGSGLASTFLYGLATSAYFIATDININACKATQTTWDLNVCKSRPSIEAIRADLVPLRHNIVDILLFNPPYVPSQVVPELPQNDNDDHWLDLALDGGDDGMQVTQRVLDALDDILSPNGAAYILFCARNKPHEISQNMQQKGWIVEHIDTRKAGIEILTVLRFTK